MEFRTIYGPWGRSGDLGLDPMDRPEWEMQEPPDCSLDLAARGEQIDVAVAVKHAAIAASHWVWEV